MGPGCEAGPATGYINFIDGGTTITQVPRASAILTWNLYTTGVHNFTAIYLGDANSSTSTSPVVAEAIVGSPMATTLALDRSSAAPGQPVQMTASVVGAATEGGAVAFKDGATTLNTVALPMGAAAYTAVFSTPGNRSLTASFPAESISGSTTSFALTEAIGRLGHLCELGFGVHYQFVEQVRLMLKLRLDGGLQHQCLGAQLGVFINAKLPF